MTQRASSQGMSKGDPVSILTQKASPQGSSKGDVLFLHGQAFSSQTWVDLKTLQIVAGLGYNAVAIDLPNGSKSKSDKVNVKDKNKFLEDVIKELKIRAPVIISPSMSGSFSLPYLFHMAPDKVKERMSGFVPVAPISTEDFTPEQYKQITIPVAIVYGENDKTIGPESVKNLSNFPSKELHELKGAGHPAYMDKPEEWHKILTDFLKKVYS
ncbi:hypothetical protein FSP39_024587 [Pinctada imbricata]|uniref:Protein ABHD14A n=1 Tax=Pinctada imbricata TaxID=66713 RepID=A0AA88XXE7_PINIB|nr:hypothetical protein FSP39_024587 [Pinctada imbricata]